MFIFAMIAGIVITFYSIISFMNKFFLSHHNGIKNISMVRYSNISHSWDIFLTTQTALLIPNRSIATADPNCFVPDRTVCAVVPDRTVCAVVPDRTIGAVIPDRTIGAVIPDRTIGAVIPDRTV
jgi:hypothetical protein